MEENNEYKELKNQMANNITSWYPFEEGIEYIILDDFCQENEYQLKDALAKMKENSMILILMKNKLSIKNICVDEDEEKNFYNRKQIEELLEKNGLIYKKFYYPLPDCKMANVIFTDKYLPDEETISRNILFFPENTIRKNKENNQYRKIFEQDNNLFKIFANSFFIECSNKPFEDNEIEFVSFSNMRKEEYRIKTIIRGKNVYKRALTEKSINHIENVKKYIDLLKQLNLNSLDRYEENTIISSYQQDKKTLDKILIQKIQKGEIEEAKNLIKNLFSELKEKLVPDMPEENVFDKYSIEYSKENIENLTFVKYGFWDMIPQNIFYIDNKYFFYDQEWMEENLPLEYIIYRTIIYNGSLQKEIDSQTIFGEFNINEENLRLFAILDNKLQEKTRCPTSWKVHTQAIDVKALVDLKNKYENEKIQLEKDKEQMSQDFEKTLNEKHKRIQILEKQLEETTNSLQQKEKAIQLIKDSKSWKITEPLRRLRSYKKGAKK